MHQTLLICISMELVLRKPHSTIPPGIISKTLYPDLVISIEIYIKDRTYSPDKHAVSSLDGEVPQAKQKRVIYLSCIYNIYKEDIGLPAMS